MLYDTLQAGAGICWTESVEVKIGSDRPENIASPAEALEKLTFRWPFPRGRHYRGAVASCQAALNSQLEPDLAREAFVWARLEAEEFFLTLEPVTRRERKEVMMTGILLESPLYVKMNGSVRKLANLDDVLDFLDAWPRERRSVAYDVIVKACRMTANGAFPAPAMRENLHRFMMKEHILADRGDASAYGSIPLRACGERGRANSFEP